MTSVAVGRWRLAARLVLGSAWVDLIISRRVCLKKLFVHIECRIFHSVYESTRADLRMRSNVAGLVQVLRESTLIRGTTWRACLSLLATNFWCQGRWTMSA